MSHPGGSPRRSVRQQGQVYDRAARQIVEGDPAAFCAWLEVPVQGSIELLSGSFPAGTVHADLLAQISKDRLLHVEYMRDAEADLAIRMLGYRARIMSTHRDKRLTQIVIVLGEGRVHSCDDPHVGFQLGLQTVYLRECPPEPLLGTPSLAPFSVLARGERGQLLARAVTSIHNGTDPGPLRDQLLEATLVMATIRVDAPTIDRIWKEIGMTVESLADFYSQTEAGRELMGRAARQARAQGREQGIEQGYLTALTDMLRERFGTPDGDANDQIDAAARILAMQPDRSSSMHTALTASSLHDILVSAGANSD